MNITQIRQAKSHWNDGVKEKKELAEKMNVSVQTASQYLKIIENWEEYKEKHSVVKIKKVLILMLMLIPIVSAQEVPLQFDPISFNETALINETLTVTQNITNIGEVNLTNTTYKNLNYPEWFSFDPNNFILSVNETKTIDIAVDPQEEINLTTALHVCYAENICYVVSFNLTVLNLTEPIEIEEEIPGVICPPIDLIVFPEGISCTGETFWNATTETCYATNCSFCSDIGCFNLFKPYPYNPTVKILNITEEIYQVNYTSLNQTYGELYGRMDSVIIEMIETRKHADAQTSALRGDIKTMEERVSSLENATYQQEIEDVEDSLFEFLRKSEETWHSKDELEETLYVSKDVISKAISELMIRGLIDSRQRIVRIKEEIPEGVLIKEKEITEFASMDRLKEEAQSASADFGYGMLIIVINLGSFIYFAKEQGWIKF